MTPANGMIRAVVYLVQLPLYTSDKHWKIHLKKKCFMVPLGSRKSENKFVLYKVLMNPNYKLLRNVSTISITVAKNSYRDYTTKC